MIKNFFKILFKAQTKPNSDLVFLKFDWAIHIQKANVEFAQQIIIYKILT